MNSPTDLDALNPDQLRALARQLMTQVDEKTRESHYRQTRIDQLTHELSVIKRLQFGRRSEQFTAEQLSLLDEAIDEDLAALQAELDELRSDAPQEKPRKQAKRLSLPPQLPRTDIHHEPTELSCPCGCRRVRIGEDISEKLDYTPGVFTVERHIRGKWACKACETLIQAPGATACDRQRDSDEWLARAGVGRQIRRPPSSVPAGTHLRPGWPSNSTIDARRLGGRMRCAFAAFGRRTSRGTAAPQRLTCRRNAGADVEPRQREDA